MASRTHRHFRRSVAGAIVAVIASGSLVSCGGADAEETARSFLAAWQVGNAKKAGGLTTGESGSVAHQLDHAYDDLAAGQPRLRLAEVKETGSGEAAADFTSTVRLSSLGVDWRYRGRFRLRESDEGWRVVWTPTVIHPSLRQGQRLYLYRQFPDRAPIYDRDGGRLVFNEDVVVVGVVPEAMKNRAHTLRVLADQTGIDAKAAAKQVDRAPRKSFLPLITLRDAHYRSVKKKIHDLPGVRFRADSLPLAKTRGYARQLLGTVGPVSAEALKKLGSPYTAADQVGANGLQGAYERQLAGVPEGRVVVADKKGLTVRGLTRFAGRDGTAVRTTLDEKVQDAAEAALTGVDKPAALVAVQASTGKVLAVANRPTDDSFDRALVGRYPPGSTFKVVSTAALLGKPALFRKKAVRPGTRVPCPPTVTAGGKSFRNFEGETAGSSTFRTDFALSCNTAFVRLSSSLDRDDLRTTATSFGFGATYALGVPAYSGQVPTSRDAAEQAAAMIGQGRVLASPLGMALVAAAVRSGSWHPPTLVTTSEVSGKARPVRLDPHDVATLRSLMRSVVTSGTARGLAGVAGKVSGKTGTAEYGSADPPRTHAWFIGFRGDLAFSVLVEDGGVGGRAAVPVAKKFLRN